jgi:probable HAF family extracellular repeat protein
MTDIGTLGGEFSRANLNNDAGQVVGGSEVADGSIHPFLWQNGTMTDLGTLPGYKSARAIRISENGIICGFAYDPVGTPTNAASMRAGFVYRDGKFTDLGSLGGLGTGCGDVNDKGQVTGASDISIAPEGETPTTHGILWENGTLTDMNDLLVSGSGWEITQAVGFNSLGQIAGWGLRNGVTHALLLTPQA